MKKSLILLLIAGLLLTGCGGGNTSDTSSQKQEENTIDNSKEDDTDSRDEMNTGVGADTESDSNTETNTEKEPYVLEFTATTIDGETMTSEIFADSKLTMINVWGTYCPPCINEMPDLGEISRERDRSEFQLIGIICDVMPISKDAEKQKAIDIIEQTKADYPHLLLNDELYYNMVGASNSVPTTYFFNEKGELLGYLVGAKSKDDWNQIIDRLLDELGKE